MMTEQYSVKELIESLQGFYSDHKFDEPGSNDVFIDMHELNGIINAALTFCKHNWTPANSAGFHYCQDCGESEYVQK